MAQKRQSLKLDDIDWQVLTGIAADCGCEYRGEPSWRRLIDQIAGGKLTVTNRPNKRVLEFHKDLKAPTRQKQQMRSLKNITAKIERDRLRQERKRRAAGIAPRGAQEELEKATGYRDEFGRPNE